MHDSMNSTATSASFETQRQLREAQAIAAELMARRALRDVYFWMTRCTKTLDEQDIENPYKPFPQDQYIRHVIDSLRNEPVWNMMKSRTMLMTWIVCAYCAHTAFNRPATGVLFYSQDEDRSVHCVNCVKTLWENSLPSLKHYWKLAKPLPKQPYNRLDMANNSWFLGIPGQNPDKIRSFHPTIVAIDEAAFVERYEEAYNIAVATRCPQIISWSSANEGHFDEIFRSSMPDDWPDYSESEQLADVPV